jgi:hypothetical protein
MPKLRKVCRNVRSKSAGPFWVTVDICFDGPENYRRYHQSEALGAAVFGGAFGIDPELVRHYAVDDLSTLKVSYPRATPQGGVVERDMHCGQQYVRLLDIELD